jgi:hypothetical protein
VSVVVMASLRMWKEMALDLQVVAELPSVVGMGPVSGYDYGKE